MKTKPIEVHCNFCVSGDIEVGVEPSCDKYIIGEIPSNSYENNMIVEDIEISVHPNGEKEAIITMNNGILLEVRNIFKVIYKTVN